jgi:hypothetical protein
MGASTPGSVLKSSIAASVACVAGAGSSTWRILIDIRRSVRADVRGAVRIVADEDRPESGGDTTLAQRHDARAQVRFHVFEKGVAVEECRSHAEPRISGGSAARR